MLQQVSVWQFGFCDVAHFLIVVRFVASVVSTLRVAMSSGSASAKALPIAKAHTALAKKVPKPPKTGNKSKDEEANSRRELMMDLISHMQWDGSHILPLYGTLNKAPG